MSYEIQNIVKGKSFIRCTGAGTYTIQLTDLRANANIESIISASISDAAWSTAGFINVSRNTELVLNLSNSGNMTNNDGILPRAGANNKTANVIIVIGTGGTLVLSLTKEATYNVDTQRALTGN